MDQPATKVEEGKEVKAHPDQDKEVKGEAVDEASAVSAAASAASAASVASVAAEGEEKQE